MKVAVIGSRGITSLDLAPFMPEGVTTIVSGGARGVDSIAAAYAREHGLELVEFLPDYEKYGRRAPIIRNRSIVDEADMVLAFWDRKSRGTKYTIDLAERIGKRVVVHEYGTTLSDSMRSQFADTKEAQQAASALLDALCADDIPASEKRKIEHAVNAAIKGLTS